MSECAWCGAGTSSGVGAAVLIDIIFKDGDGTKGERFTKDQHLKFCNEEHRRLHLGV